MVDNAKEIIRRAESIRGIYVMGGAGPNVWDCSGFVGYCVGASAGTRLFATPNEGAVLSAAGYKDMRGIVDLDSGAGMKPGDVLIYNKPGTNGLYSNGHTEIYYGNGVTIGAREAGKPVGIQAPLVSVNRPSKGLGSWQECWRAPRSGVFIKSVTGNLNS